MKRFFTVLKVRRPKEKEDGPLSSGFGAKPPTRRVAIGGPAAEVSHWPLEAAFAHGHRRAPRSYLTGRTPRIYLPSSFCYTCIGRPPAIRAGPFLDPLATRLPVFQTPQGTGPFQVEESAYDHTIRICTANSLDNKGFRFLQRHT